MVRTASPAPGYRGKTGSPRIHSKTKSRAHPKVQIDRSEQQRQRLQENQAYAGNPNVKAFLAAIAEAEGGAPNLTFGGIKGRQNDPHIFTDFSTHPMAGKNGTTAAGSYQINVATWREMGDKMGITDFTEDHQALMAIEIIRIKGAIEDVAAGDLIKALPKVAGRWAALPQGPGKGNRYPKQHYKSYEEFVKYFEAAGGKVKEEITNKVKSTKPAK